MSETDQRGLPLSTSSPGAASAYRHGLDLLLSAWPGAIDAFRAAIAADPDFGLAHAALARAFAARAEMAEAKAAIARAEMLVASRGSERERSHVAALASAIAGRTGEAIERVRVHAESWPRDALILSLPLGAFGLFAFSGMADHDQARVDLCERHAGHYGPDDWWFLTYRGWSHAENGEVALGRRLAERAFALREANANAVHALSHAMFEDGSGRDAEALIAGWLPGYDRGGALHGHISWHEALVALEEGDVWRALAIYEARVAPDANAAAPLNVLSDTASFLWRLDAYGHGAPKELWRSVASYAANAYPKGGNAFVEAHLALIAAATGDVATLDARLAAIAGRGAPADATIVAIGRAAEAFASGAWARCTSILEPVAADIPRMGGSHAQREVIEDTLLVALMRSGEAARAATLLDARLHRRPSPRDTRWREALREG